MAKIHRRLKFVWFLSFMTTTCVAAFTENEIAEIKSQFDEFDVDKNGHITSSEISEILKALGESLPGYQIRDMIKEVDTDENGTVEFNEYIRMYELSASQKQTFQLFRTAEKAKKLVAVEGISEEGSAAGTGSAVSHSDEQKIAFTEWINYLFEGDADLSGRLPISTEGSALFEALKDGIILCKLINSAVPDTVDERAINKANLNTLTKNENNLLVLNSASSIGANIVNIGAEDLLEGRPHLVLGLVWQIIRTGLMAKITLENNPQLVALLQDGESIEDILKLSPEEILLRWVNYHMEKAGSARRISNFQGDIADSEVYTILLNQVAPAEGQVSLSPLEESDLEKRAEKMLTEAEKLDVRHFVTPKDVVKGNGYLNLAFLSFIYNTHPALVASSLPDFDLGDFAETREERTFRNWMNSLGVTPYVNHIYSDLSSGLVLLQLIDKVKPGVVDWSKVTQKFRAFAAMQEKLQNCNYVVELCHQLKFSMVGIGGNDILDENKTLTLAVVWQIMRSYTLSVLQPILGSDKPIADAEIVDWTNTKLSEASKSSGISSFKDTSISTSIPVIDLVDVIEPGSINYDLVTGGASDEDQLSNARYAIAMARKIGARVYAQPEDVVEVQPKMMLTVFATLMTRASQTKSTSREIELINELMLLELLQLKYI